MTKKQDSAQKEKVEKQEPVCDQCQTNDVDELCQACAQLKEELEKEKQSKLVVLADLVNFRKRMDREREEMHVQANRRILLHIIEVIDDLNRAIENEKQDNVLLMLLNKLGSILKDYSLEQIKCDKGDVFDPNTMEAITAVNASKDEERGKVMDVISSGYRNTVNGQIFKSVKVIIAR